MSALPGGFNVNDPFASRRGGTFDKGALQGLYLRAKKGDRNAAKYLQDLGVLGGQGQDIFAPTDVQANSFAPAIDAWAQASKSTPLAQGGFAYDPAWGGTTDNGQFSQSWDKWFQTGGTGTDFTTGAQQTKILGQRTVTGPTGSFALDPKKNFGYDYSAPSQNWNPWLLRSDQGGNDGGFYNAQQDKIRFDSGRGNGSTMNTADTIWRWVEEDARKITNNVGALDAATIGQLTLNAIARMHRDFDANKLDWADSGFAKYESYRADTAAPATAAQPGTTLAPGATAPPTSTYTNPTTGGTTTVANQNPQTLRNIALLSDQDQYLAQLMRKLGLDPTRQGWYTSSIAEALDPVARANAQLNGLYGDRNAIDTAEQSLNELAGTLSGPGGFGRIQQQARGLLGDPRRNGLLNDLGDKQAVATMQTLLSQAYAGSNRIYNTARLNQFNRAFGPGGQYSQQALDNVGNPQFPRPADWLAGTEFADLLRGY